MADLDLDALRIARAEANGEAHAIKLAGESYQLPGELPFDAALTMAEGDMLGALKQVLSAPDFERFQTARPTVNDMVAIAEYLQDIYGKTAGESSASETS